MSENATELDGDQRRKKWLARLADEFLKGERLLPRLLVANDADCPKWVENIEREIALVLFPAAKLKNVQGMTGMWFVNREVSFFAFFL